MQRPITDAHVVIVEKFAIPMTVGKIQCLRPSVWLNDEVINFYCEMLMPKRWVHCFSTFFFVKLLERGSFNYKRVARWTKKLNVFALTKIFIPVHLPGHWAIIYIDVKPIGE
jgi:Ulp1 family protease